MSRFFFVLFVLQNNHNFTFYHTKGEVFPRPDPAREALSVLTQVCRTGVARIKVCARKKVFAPT
jgi:hypothetical protein